MHEFPALGLISRPWFHSSTRTIFHTWQTNPDELFFNTWLMTKIQFNFPLTLEITSKFLKSCHNNFNKIFGKVWKSSKNCWQYAEVAGTFSETPVITGRKSHALINLTQKELASIYWHVCICIKDNHRWQEEPAILISMHVCRNSLGLPQRMYGMHRMHFEHVRLDLISLVITYILTTTQSSALDRSESVLTFNRCRPQSAAFITSNIK